MAAIDLKAGKEAEFLIGQKLNLDTDASIRIDIMQIGREGRWPELWRIRYWNKGKEQELFVPSRVFFIMYNRFKLSISNDVQGTYRILCEHLE